MQKPLHAMVQQRTSWDATIAVKLKSKLSTAMYSRARSSIRHETRPKFRAAGLTDFGFKHDAEQTMDCNKHNQTLRSHAVNQTRIKNGMN
jgi:hypothetical protein